MTQTAEPVIPAQVDKCNLIPKTYRGNLRTFTLVEPDMLPVASGAVFTDGRIVVASQTGSAMYRYKGMPEFVSEWASRSTFPLWTGHDAPPDPDHTPRRFITERHRDTNQISGTGISTEGVVFPHGGVSLMWLGKVRSLAEWESIELAMAMHGHDGDTVVRWLD